MARSKLKKQRNQTMLRVYFGWIPTRCNESCQTMPSSYVCACKAHVFVHQSRHSGPKTITGAENVQCGESAVRNLWFHSTRNIRSCLHLWLGMSVYVCMCVCVCVCVRACVRVCVCVYVYVHGRKRMWAQTHVCLHDCIVHAFTHVHS